MDSTNNNKPLNIPVEQIKAYAMQLHKAGDNKNAYHWQAIATSIAEEEKEAAEKKAAELEATQTPLGKSLQAQIWIAVPPHTSKDPLICWTRWLAVNESARKVFLTDGGRKAFGRRYREMARQAGVEIHALRTRRKIANVPDKVELWFRPSEAAMVQATFEDMFDNATTNMIMINK